jgi:hypothetical protein
MRETVDERRPKSEGGAADCAVRFQKQFIERVTRESTGWRLVDSCPQLRVEKTSGAGSLDAPRRPLKT